MRCAAGDGLEEHAEQENMGPEVDLELFREVKIFSEKAVKIVVNERLCFMRSSIVQSGRHSATSERRVNRNGSFRADGTTRAHANGSSQLLGRLIAFVG